MSYVKRLLEQQEAERHAAIEIAVAANVLARCEVDDDPIDAGVNDVEEAYKVGNAMISREDPRVAVFGKDRRKMTDTVKSVVEELRYATCSHEADFERAMSRDD